MILFWIGFLRNLWTLSFLGFFITNGVALNLLVLVRLRQLTSTDLTLFLSNEVFFL